MANIKDIEKVRYSINSLIMLLEESDLIKPELITNYIIELEENWIDLTGKAIIESLSISCKMNDKEGALASLYLARVRLQNISEIV